MRTFLQGILRFKGFVRAWVAARKVVATTLNVTNEGDGVRHRLIDFFYNSGEDGLGIRGVFFEQKVSMAIDNNSRKGGRAHALGFGEDAPVSRPVQRPVGSVHTPSGWTS
jgi:hypothetical protein